MEAIYNQNGFVLESLGKTMDNQRIAKVFLVTVAHKIDADEFNMTLLLSIRILLRSFPFFTQNSDYDTIAMHSQGCLAEALLKRGPQGFFKSFSPSAIFLKTLKVLLACLRTDLNVFIPAIGLIKIELGIELIF